MGAGIKRWMNRWMSRRNDVDGCSEKDEQMDEARKMDEERRMNRWMYRDGCRYGCREKDEQMDVARKMKRWM